MIITGMAEGENALVHQHIHQVHRFESYSQQSTKGNEMNCSKCGTKMIREDLKFSCYVGPYKYAYYCKKCNEKEEKTRRTKTWKKMQH